MISKSYNRVINKEDIPVCSILGVDIAAINMKWFINFINKNIRTPEGNLMSGDYICVANVHTTVTAYDDSKYCSIQNKGLMTVPDGGPLSTIGRKRGYKNMQRIAGPDIMKEIFQISKQNGYRHFFYGSTQETLKELHVKLINSYPGIQISGMYSPPFAPVDECESEAIINVINNSSPDFVWVGLGAPKQERWMARHQGKIKGVMLGVGAGFDYFAGNIRRAPLWMQQSNLEWLYRLLQEPRRLFGRYWNTNWKFIWNAYLKGR